MPYCLQCHRVVCTPCKASNDNNKPKHIVLATDRELMRTSHFYRLAIATKALGLPRRDIPNWMADVIFAYDGLITWPDGSKVNIGDEDIDAVFNDDGSFRWLSDFMHVAEAPPRQTPQIRVLARLRMIDLAFRIAHPSRAYWIAK